VAFDLKTFFTVVGREPREVAPADMFGLLADQRGDRRVVRLSDRESGLSARTIARRLWNSAGTAACRAPDHHRRMWAAHRVVCQLRPSICCSAWAAGREIMTASGRRALGAR
jgi:hypothetical protein